MPKSKRVIYFVANPEDKPGAALKLIADLKAANIPLVGLWGYGMPDGRAKIYAVAKNPDKLRTKWTGAGILAEEGTGFMITGADKTGVLVKSLEGIAAAGINMKMMDAVAVSGKFALLLWVDPSQVENTAKALGCK
jgi:prephenate dehydratase